MVVHNFQNYRAFSLKVLRRSDDIEQWHMWHNKLSVITESSKGSPSMRQNNVAISTIWCIKQCIKQYNMGIEGSDCVENTPTPTGGPDSEEKMPEPWWAVRVQSAGKRKWPTSSMEFEHYKGHQR